MYVLFLLQGGTWYFTPEFRHLHYSILCHRDDPSKIKDAIIKLQPATHHHRAESWRRALRQKRPRRHMVDAVRTRLTYERPSSLADFVARWFRLYRGLALFGRMNPLVVGKTYLTDFRRVQSFDAMLQHLTQQTRVSLLTTYCIPNILVWWTPHGFSTTKHGRWGISGLRAWASYYLPCS